MRKIFVAAALVLGFALSGFSSQAFAEAKQDFTLVNKTGYQLKEVYVSPSKSSDWEEDVLGQATLDDGENVEIKFHRANTTCDWDLKVVYSDDNSSAVWSNLNLCEISKITIKYDRKTDTTSASVE